MHRAIKWQVHYFSMTNSSRPLNKLTITNEWDNTGMKFDENRNNKNVKSLIQNTLLCCFDILIFLVQIWLRKEVCVAVFGIKKSKQIQN